MVGRPAINGLPPVLAENCFATLTYKSRSIKGKRLLQYVCVQTCRGRSINKALVPTFLQKLPEIPQSLLHKADLDQTTKLL